MAGSSGSFRELEDKPCSAEINLMKWSPKMDLIALITAEGEVLLHRLSWKRVWNISTSEGKAVQMAWRPDGKLLSVGYKDGAMKLFDVENGECVHTCNIGEIPTCMDWVEHEKDSNLRKDIEKQPFNVDKAELLLPPLPSLPKSGETLFSKDSSEEVDKDPKKLASLPEELNILTIGDSKGQIHVYLYGIFLCSVVKTENTDISSVVFSSDLKVMSAVVRQLHTNGDQQTILLEVYSSPLLNSRQYELSVIAKKIGTVATLMEYFQKTITLMSEAWEDILLEMDTKLTTFASEMLAAGSSVSQEFLTLLTKGTSSPELQSFLLHELTEKGLKKLGHNIENSYSSIQGLALKHLDSVIQALLFHLTELLGMAKWYDHYGILGLSEESVQGITRMLGSVMLKTRELVDVIESSLKSFKAFFQWLYSVILRLSDEPIPSYIKQSSQEDVVLVAHFLQNQLKVNQHGKFSLERVGQYFEDSELSCVSSYGNTPWTKYVADSPLLSNSPLILQHSSNTSLVTLAKCLEDKMQHAFKKLADTMSNSFQCKCNIHLVSCSLGSLFQVGQISMKASVCQSLVFSVGENSEKAFLVNLENVTDTHPLSIKATSLSFSSLPTDQQIAMSVLDVKFYDANTITVLLKERHEDGEGMTYLAQIPTHLLQDEGFIFISTSHHEDPLSNNPALNVQDVGPRLALWRRIQGFQSGSIAVSGSRKVCCNLSMSRRRVKLYDMDAEDEDDEEDEEETSKNETKDMEQNGELSFNQ
ncbi:anaphase-promoting complex subunit 4 [Exaiptasia diaphana]|uniref:Anaphase-promoting complex subunit 4 n=1 Tax=Exaiptasia diaphana TaxID=2652724 RepID=A0A913WXI6_EXADI|nr:anaphase-promoting complex subunit 4 [Exaiptasia diaphana]